MRHTAAGEEEISFLSWQKLVPSHRLQQDKKVDTNMSPYLPPPQFQEAISSQLNEQVGGGLASLPELQSNNLDLPLAAIPGWC